ncbi:hypothetical protein BdWA1_000092 [Babesia duncani]|uniref:RRM domain-containing protein n=1 Tax=Babesia duncani TaxID=323732 RepID=A0AAD9UPS4_9APIC|nr:hypothetical protein BdWA1_000092 [Babesia duncani]
MSEPVTASPLSGDAPDADLHAPKNDEEGGEFNSPIYSESTDLMLQELVDAVMNGCVNEDSDEEEGAIDEEEVPFERVKETVQTSNCLLLLNLPLEFSMEQLVPKVTKYAIIKYCFSSKPTEATFIFSTNAIAAQAKQLLDGIKLKNRTIQAMLVAGESHLPPPQAPNLRMNNYAGNKMHANNPPVVHHRRMTPAPPVSYPRPPPPHPLFTTPPVPPVPQSRYGTFGIPQCRYGTSDSQEMRQSSNRIQFGRLVHALQGKTLVDILNSNVPISDWQPDQSFEEQQLNFDKLHEASGVTNRYLIVGGLDPEITSSIEAASEWLSKITPKRAEIEITNMPSYIDPSECDSSLYLHVTLPRRADCTHVMQTILSQGLAKICKYGAPRKALESIWLGNIVELCGYCKDEDDLKRFMEHFGPVKYVCLRYERGCGFVSYGDISSSIEARNKLVGLCLSGNRHYAINVDFAIADTRIPHEDASTNFKRNVAYQSPDVRDALVSALLSKTQGDEVARKLLSDNNNDRKEVLALISATGRKRPMHGRPDRQDRMDRQDYKWARGPHKRVAPPDHGPPEHVKRRYINNGPQKLFCQLFKRGKLICSVSAIFIRGDCNCVLPTKLDVNQRANPERLANNLSKQSEVSLWQLGADTKDDCPKYNGLCDYLITKNRVALVQEGDFEIYICPPCQQFVDMLRMPDSDYMYAYIMPKDGNQL